MDTAWRAETQPAVAWALIPTVVLPARIPFELFLNDVATHSTMGLLPVWRLQAKYFDLGTIPEAIFLASLGGAAIFAVYTSAPDVVTARLHTRLLRGPLA